MNVEDVHRADCMLLTDAVPRNVDAIFFHARAHGDYDDLFELVAEKYHGMERPLVFINGGNGAHINGFMPYESWGGGDWWRQELIKRGVTKAHIFMTKDAFHTREESEGFVELSRGAGVRRALVVVQPHQMLRAFLTLIKAMSDAQYMMRAYALAPHRKNTESWWRPIYYSSAMIPSEKLPPIEERYKARFELVGGEVSKIPEYQAKGHLASLDDLFKYLRMRESII